MVFQLILVTDQAPSDFKGELRTATVASMCCGSCVRRIPRHLTRACAARTHPHHPRRLPGTAQAADRPSESATPSRLSWRAEQGSAPLQPPACSTAVRCCAGKRESWGIGSKSKEQYFHHACHRSLRSDHVERETTSAQPAVRGRHRRPSRRRPATPPQLRPNQCRPPPMTWQPL